MGVGSGLADLTAKNEPAKLPRKLLPNKGDMFAQEIGLHFCRFSMEKELGETVVKTIQKSQLGSAITYGLMLPYVPKHISFQRQYTVVFWDWEVLLCDNSSSSKGLPSIDADVYSVEYLGLLDVLRQV